MVQSSHNAALCGIAKTLKGLTNMTIIENKPTNNTRKNSVLSQIDALFVEGIAADSKKTGATAKLALAYWDATKSGELLLDAFTHWAETARSGKDAAQSDKDKSAAFLASLCAMSHHYNDALKVLDNSTGNTITDVLARGRAGAVVSSVKTMIRNATYALIYCAVTQKATALKVSDTGELRLLGIKGDQFENEQVSVKRAADSVPKGSRTPRTPQAATKTAPITLSGATKFLTKEVTGKTRADFSKERLGELSDLMSQLVGVFGIASVPKIYASKAKGTKAA